MDFNKTILRRWLSFPILNYNDCNGDSFLCVLQVDSMTIKAPEDLLLTVEGLLSCSLPYICKLQNAL